MVELEVLKRSGSQNEQMYADKIIPLIRNSHYLLVTLLLNNAAAMEALPIFLDKLVDPVTAIIVSVTAVLFFGEIIPQSICSRRVGAAGPAHGGEARAVRRPLIPRAYAACGRPVRAMHNPYFCLLRMGVLRLRRWLG